jgi:hypothetical protein
MKKITSSIIYMLFFASCVVSNYYQVFKTEVENGIVSDNKIIFEDKNCSVYYNLWGQGGNAGFGIFNKTESDLTVYLTKTFFVLNGIAYEYFQNRTFSKSTNTATSISSYNYPYYWNNNFSKVEGSNSLGYSVSFNEKPFIVIPTKTLINISEFKVINSRFSNCNLVKYPSRREIETLKYRKENSPFVFYNLITYATTSDTIRLENKFYVSEITNYPSTEMFNNVDTSICGRRLEFPIQVFSNSAPNKFFIK